MTQDTTIKIEQQPQDDSLKVLPLDLLNETSSISEYESQAKLPTSGKFHNDMEKILNAFDHIGSNDAIANNRKQQQNSMIEKDYSVDITMEKEGRAINFPLEILKNNENSTESIMQMNYVTTSTDKTHTTSFFDLEDVSMDHDDYSTSNDEGGEKKKNEYLKKDKKPLNSKDKIDGEMKSECSFNGTSYKVCIFISYIYFIGFKNYNSIYLKHRSEKN